MIVTTKPKLFAHSMPKKSATEVELEFTKMLAARLLTKLETGKDYLNSYDHEAMNALRDAHPQDIGDTDLEWISLDQWESMNPGYKYRE